MVFVLLTFGGWNEAAYISAELKTGRRGMATALLAGIARTYRPKDEEGETFPPESTRVQIKANDIIRQTTEALTKLFDATAAKDWTNCQAKADVVVDGQTLLEQVPATYLLFLEKQLVDLHTFVKKLPVLDASETWTFDASEGCPTFCWRPSRSDWKRCT